MKDHNIIIKLIIYIYISLRVEIYRCLFRVLYKIGAYYNNNMTTDDDFLSPVAEFHANAVIRQE